YPRYMAETAGRKVLEPSSMLLEMSAAGGVVALAGLMLVFVLFIRAVRRWWVLSSTTPAPAEEGAEEQAERPPVRWEYYTGGMLGLILSFALHAGAAPQAELVSDAIATGIRSAVWFTAFALFEGIAWSAGEYVAALTAGLAS